MVIHKEGGLREGTQLEMWYEFLEKLLGGDENSIIYKKINWESPRAIEDELMRIRSLLHEWRKKNITEIGDLWLTSGGRVVLDRGYGECFSTTNDRDVIILTLEELKRGMKYKDFKKKLDDAFKKHKKLMKKGYNESENK